MPYELPSPLNDAAAVVLVAVFLIVFVTAYQALKRLTLFGSPGTFVLAGCVALLSVLGLMQFTAAPPRVSPENRPVSGHNVNVDLILLPYAALAVAIVLTTLLAWISRRFRGHHSRGAIEARRHKLERSKAHSCIKEDELAPTRRCSPRVRQIHQ